VLSQRPIDLRNDEPFLLDLACQASFDSGDLWTRSRPYKAYRDQWLASPLRQAYVRDLQNSLEDARTVAEVWQEDGQPAGFLWLCFTDSPFGFTSAALRQLTVAMTHQRRGIGTLMLKSAVERSRQQGADFIRVETGIDDEASQTIYGREGFRVVRLAFELALSEADVQ